MFGLKSHSHCFYKEYSGGRSIGRFSALGVGGYEFESHFSDYVRKLEGKDVRINNNFAFNRNIGSINNPER